MKIGIDARLALSRGRGWRRYAVEFLRELAMRPVSVHVLALDRRKDRALLESLDLVASFVPEPAHAGPDYASAFMADPAAIAPLNGVDLLHSLTRFLPAFSASPVIATVHDLAPLATPAFKGEIRRATLAALRRMEVMRASVIAVSEETRQDVLRNSRIGPQRVCVIPPGAGLIGKSACVSCRDDARSMLYVGGAGENKNIARLLEAVALVPGARLTLVGAPEWGYDRYFRGEGRVRRGEAEIEWLGEVTDRRLRELYESADLLVCPSLHEGFGLPIAEAMALGLPVCCSDIPVFREVGGDALLYFDPEEPAAIAAVLAHALGNADLRKRMSVAGLAMAGAFRWEQAVTRTLLRYEQVLAEWSPAPSGTAEGVA